MTVKIIQDKFESYNPLSKQEAENAMAEIVQEIVLAALSRSDFFKHAIFQSGTALRILYGLQRFSEDLDFILKQPDPSFRFETYLKNMKTEFESYGIELIVEDRSNAPGTVKKAFLKSDSFGKILVLKNLRLEGRLRQIRIKLEVDTNPPGGCGFETKYLDFPFPFPVTVQDLPSLFAGKVHALLCRAYTKGRDWFDFVWYVGRRTPLNLKFLSAAIDQNGPWQGSGIVVDKEWFITEMEKKIRSVDWDEAKQDVHRFLKMEDLHTVEFWKADYFMDRLNLLSEYL